MLNTLSTANLWKLRILGFILCTYLGVQSLTRAHHLSQENALFRQGSEIVDARAIDGTLKTQKNKNTKTYTADLTFTTRTGENIVVQRSYIHTDEVQAIQDGASVSRRYAINNPQKIRINNRPEVSPAPEFMFGGASMLMAVYLMWRIYRALGQRKKS